VLAMRGDACLSRKLHEIGGGLGSFAARDAAKSNGLRQAMLGESPAVSPHSRDPE